MHTPESSACATADAIFLSTFSVSVCNLCKNDNFSHLYTRGNKNKSKDVTYAKWLHDQQTVLNMCSNVNRASEEGLILSIEHFSCIPHTGAASTHAHTATMCAPSWIQSSQEWKTKTEEFKTILIVLARHFSFSASNTKHITNIAWHIGRRFCVLRFANATLHAAHGAQCTMFNLLKWNTTCELLEWPPKRSECKKKPACWTKRNFAGLFSANVACARACGYSSRTYDLVGKAKQLPSILIF